MGYMQCLVDAKYHLAVAERMLKNFAEFQDKRFLIGVINGSARATSNLIKAFLIREQVGGKNIGKNIKLFMKVIVPKYLDDLTGENLFKVLEVERAQKSSPIEYAREDKIILLIEGKYRFLTARRISEFVNSIRNAIDRF